MKQYQTLSGKASKTGEELLKEYLSVRQKTIHICSRLEKEDYVVQPCTEVSPPKWHLGHTTWFFEELILIKFFQSIKRFNEKFPLLFNSYYKSSGKHWLQGERGQLSRPTVEEVLDYRKATDDNISKLFLTYKNNPEIDLLLELGIHHEQQHQELLYMDIKYIFGINPLLPQYSEAPLVKAQKPVEGWKAFKEGVYEIGHHNPSFSYDNEGPRHKTYIHPFRISENTVTNGEYLEFIKDKGYSIPLLWLSEGWDWINNHNIHCPHYWFEMDDVWHEFTLHGHYPLDLNAPVSHISYFEADAFARWKGLRLPTEQETEIFLEGISEDPSLQNEILQPYSAETKVNQVWCWTRSQYSPYPGFQVCEGPIGEYNGKFMCNQFVLKGGCIATPYGHYRPSYRNFYKAQQRWMFSGIRLAKDLI
ncbi:MAG: ergothioneine biosynthesis protein EgtB [Leptospiraceae bacterium]|nr:ergothioneine biosynthesis protein EgtB [Leptospiraceae bacterium]MCP5501167.1 ergothioneine biosynthesis protein EgtB [Leptospiraceae bacterium]